jgi:UDP-2,3-diacylglucosamine pyrophosphatase LpxH
VGSGEFVKKIKLVISDLHLGKGRYMSSGLPNMMEDFTHDEKLVEFLNHYSKGKGRDDADEVELVINGDFLEYLMIDSKGENTQALYEDSALELTKEIVAGHPKVFKALKDFCNQDGCSITYQMGNHDPSIIWPAVQAYLREVVSENLKFSFDYYSFDDVRIEHGHQRESIYQFDMNNLILPSDSDAKREVPVLNFPFGCFFVLNFVAKLKEKRYYVSQVVPFRLYLRWAIFYDFWFAFMLITKVIYFFLKMRFVRHPNRFSRFFKTVKIIKEIINTQKLEAVGRKVLDGDIARIVIMGHNHEAAIRLYPEGKQYLNTGTWIEFTSFEPGLLGRHTVLSYAFLEKIDDEPWKADLKNWRGKWSEQESLRW